MLRDGEDGTRAIDVHSCRRGDAHGEVCRRRVHLGEASLVDDHVPATRCGLDPGEGHRLPRVRRAPAELEPRIPQAPVRQASERVSAPPSGVSTRPARAVARVRGMTGRGEEGDALTLCPDTVHRRPARAVSPLSHDARSGDLGGLQLPILDNADRGQIGGASDVLELEGRSGSRRSVDEGPRSRISVSAGRGCAREGKGQ
jgi:hypothetical protein